MIKTLFYLMIVLSPLRIGRPIKDSADFVEVNHVYRYSEASKKYEKAFVQIIWWEWRDYLLTKDINGYKKDSGFAVKDYRVVWSSSSRPQKTMDIEPRLFRGKWVCLFYDKTSGKVREVESRWKRETYTDFDVEVRNRLIVPIKERNKLRKN